MIESTYTDCSYPFLAISQEEWMSSIYHWFRTSNSVHIKIMYVFFKPNIAGWILLPTSLGQGWGIGIIEPLVIIRACTWHNGKEFACQCRRLGCDPLDWEDPLEEKMTTHSSILAWKIPWTGAWQVQSTGSQKSRLRLSLCAEGSQSAPRPENCNWRCKDKFFHQRETKHFSVKKAWHKTHSLSSQLHQFM